MTQLNTPKDPADATMASLSATICDFLLPFFLTAAGCNQAAARATVSQLISAYDPRTAAELDLVGRIIGFSIAAMDNLRLSMKEDLPDTKLLRYRSNAVTLSRASEQARQILRAQQENRETTKPIPRPAIAAAPKPPAAAQKPDKAPPAAIAIPATRNDLPISLEAMKADARLLMDAFSKQGVQASTAIGLIPDPASIAKSISAAAIAAVRRS